MNAETFNMHLTHMQQVTVETLVEKAAEYATADRLHNFKTAAVLEDLTPIGALAGMMAKHTVSVYDLINRTDNGEETPEALWEEKIKDHINYLLLLWALVHEGDG